MAPGETEVALVDEYFGSLPVDRTVERVMVGAGIDDLARLFEVQGAVAALVVEA